MEPKLFIRSWPALWLWMQYLNEQIKSKVIGLSYTYRKGRLDIQFLDGDTVFLLSWEKIGNQVTISSSKSASLPRRRVEVLRKIPSMSVVQEVYVHAQDKLLKIELSRGNYLIFGAYPGANNIYYLEAGSLRETFLKQDKLPAIEDSWLSTTDPLPLSLPGGMLTQTELTAAKDGLSVNWDNSKIKFGLEASETTLNISDFVIDVLKHGNKPKLTTSASLQKTAQTVLKRWKNKASKIELELAEARSWPDLRLRLQILQTGLGMGMSGSDGQLTIPEELSPTQQAVSIKIDSGITLQQAIESTAKKIRKYKGKLVQLQEVLAAAGSDIKRLELILEDSDDHRLLKFLQEHGESLDRSGKHQVERKPYKKYQSPGGFDILVGRSSQDNDSLTFKIANKNDWWFHARQVRGSHVILRTGSQTPQEADIKAAAKHAALNSKAMHSGVVVVQYCQRKHISKPRAAHPGAVLVHQEQSITIDLD